MKAVLQRVLSSKVSVDGRVIGQIGRGLNVLLGVGAEDDETIIPKFVEKIVNLRVFSDEQGKMNRSLLDIQGEVLVISQFTLYTDCAGGRRPSFAKAAQPEKAEKIYRLVVQTLKSYSLKVATGEFGAYMAVEITNDGPVTIILDSRDI